MCKIDQNKMDKILELKDVTYTYEGERLPVWKSLSCNFYRGKIHAICGPSGCGKSSILNLIDGLIPHMYEGELEGQVLYEGRDISLELPRYRCEDIGFVMQNPESQFCTFTVEEELAFGMENLGILPEEMKNRIRNILSFIGMEGYEKRDLSNLSGGQKQKIAIASVLVTRPKILLLDEPTANLDPKSRKQIFQLIVRTAREENITVILVEHNIREMIDQVDRLLLLGEKGQILLDCSADAKEAVNWREVNHHFSGTPQRKNVCHDSEEIVKIDGLSFSYPLPGRRKKKTDPVLRELNLSIYKKDFLAIVGENGVGKTTLMKLLFKVNKPDAGVIRIFGKDLRLYRTRELYRQMGLVFQNPENQFITNTVQDEMMFSLKKVHMDEKEKEIKVREMLERFHLEEEKGKSPFTLSQGQKRRLSVASMLLTDQKLLFLDEPTYGQDFENRQELMKDMQGLVEKGVTIVMITHDLELVRQYATRVVEIEEGSVVKDMPTEEYFRDRGGRVCLPI